MFDFEVGFIDREPVHALFQLLKGLYFLIFAFLFPYSGIVSVLGSCILSTELLVDLFLLHLFVPSL